MRRAADQKLIRLKPDDASVRFNLGNALFNAGRFQEATAAYTETVSLKPDFAHAHYNRGWPCFVSMTPRPSN